MSSEFLKTSLYMILLSKMLVRRTRPFNRVFHTCDRSQRRHYTYSDVVEDILSSGIIGSSLTVRE